MTISTTQEEEARLEDLYSLQLLDTPAEERFDRIVRLAQRLFKVPDAAVSLVDRDRLFIKSAAGSAFRTSPREGSPCDQAIRSPETYVVSDARSDPELRTHPAVTGEPHLRFYAGAPLNGPGGHRIGTLCLFDRRSRDLSATEHTLLRELADWVETELASDQELERAADVQRALLPTTTPELPGYDIAGQCVPARHVGGDFYDWFPTRNGLQVTVADVMGKGTGAAILGAGLRALLRGASRFNELGEAFHRVAFSIENDLAETATFATVWAARIDSDTHLMSYVDAGHGLTVVLTADGAVRRLSSDGLPLGALPGDTWTLHEMVLQPGDTVVCCSDGVLDYYPDLAAWEALFPSLAATTASAGELVDVMMTTMAGQGPALRPADDVTIVVIRRARA